MNTNHDQFYLTSYHGRKKFGVTCTSHARFGASQYNTGGFNNDICVLYFSESLYSDHIKRLEKLVKRELYNYLMRSSKDPNKALEFIDEKHEHIDIPYMQKTVEELIIKYRLKIRRLKSVYLASIRMDNNFENRIRENPEKYLEPI